MNPSELPVPPQGNQPTPTNPPAATPVAAPEPSFTYQYNPQVYGQLLGLFARDASAKPKPNE